MSVLKKPSKHRVFLTLILALVIAGRVTAQNIPNNLVIFSDDVGQTNISAYSFGVVGYRTPNLDALAHAGMMFTPGGGN